MKNTTSLESLKKFYDNYNDIVYIMRVDTYELVYLNRAGQKAFHFQNPEEYVGQPCYRMIQEGQPAPCEICNCDLLHENVFYTWTYENQKLGNYYKLRDTLFSCDGITYRLEVAEDLDIEMEQNKAIDEMSGNERMINEALDLAMNETDPDASINIMLSYLGEHLGSDRVYIFEETKRGTISNTYEWCAQGVTPEKDNLQDGSKEQVKIWYDEFDKHHNILIENLEDYKEVSLQMYNILKPQGIHSLVVGPLTVDNHRIGFYGVDNPPYASIESISTMFDILGHFISALIRHRDNVKKLEVYSYIDQMTGLKNRHALDHFLTQIDKDQPVAYFFCDLNGLKKMNDTEGHDAGDELICNSAAVLTLVFEPVPVFRMGGDEFLAIMTGITEAEAQKKETELKAAFHEANISVAIGSIWKETAVESFDSLFQEVDASMYKDKRAFYGERRHNGSNPHGSDRMYKDYRLDG